MSKEEDEKIELELSRPLIIESISKVKPRIEKLEASVEECEALAKRFDLKELLSFKGKMEIRRVSSGGILRVIGSLKAELVQLCVISSEDIFSKIDITLDDDFIENGKVFDRDPDFDIKIENEFDQVVKAGIIDIGELAAQHLSLKINPYPKAPGVSLASQASELGDNKKPNPFDILKNLKDKKLD